MAVQNDRFNVLYCGMENPLTIAVAGARPESIIITSTDGNIKKDTFGRPGDYRIKPERPGAIEVTAFVKKKGKLLKQGSTIFRVKRIPLEVSFCGRNGGNLPAKEVYYSFGPQAFVGAGWLQDCRWGGALLMQFTLIVERHGREIFRKTMIGKNGVEFNGDAPRIDETTRAFFKKLRNNDKLTIEHALWKVIDGTVREAEPMNFTITNAKELKTIGHEKPVVVIDPITGVETIKK